MGEWINRELHVSAVDVRNSERLVTGIAVPWDERTEIHERGLRFYESFQRGAFAQVIRAMPARRPKAFREHRDTIGVARLLEEREVGLWAELYLSRGRSGDEVLELANDGALDHMSIRFMPVKDIGSEIDGEVVRAEVRLAEISLVPFAAYAGATVAEVRSEVEVATPALDALRALRRERVESGAWSA